MIRADRAPAETRRLPGSDRFGILARCFRRCFDIRSDSPEALLIIRSHLEHAVAPQTLGAEAPTTRVEVACGVQPGQQWSAAAAGRSIITVEGFAGEFWEHVESEGARLWRRACTPGQEQVIIEAAGAWRIGGTSAELAALTAIRVCREILRAQYANADAIDLHSALCFHPVVGGVLFVGDSGAGKTTLALALAQQGGLLISSDQTSLLPGTDGGMLGTALPNAHRVRSGTLERLTAERGDVTAPLLRDRLAPLAGNPITDKAWMTSLETEVLLGIPSATVSAVDLFVFLSAAPGLRQPCCAPVAPGDVAGLLRDELRVHDPLHPAFWLVGAVEQPAGPAGLRRAADLIGNTRLLRLSWDPQKHSVTEVITHLSGKAST